MWDPHTCAHTHTNTRRRTVGGSGLKFYNIRCYGVCCILCVCAAMFNETTGAVCPSHNKYTRLSPRHPVTVVLRLPVHLVIALPPAPPSRLRPQQPPPVLPLSSLPFNRKRHFIVLYTRTNVHTTSLAVQLRNDDVSPPLPLLNIPTRRFCAPNAHTPFLHPSANHHRNVVLLVRYPLSSTTDVVPGRRSIYSPERGLS